VLQPDGSQVTLATVMNSGAHYSRRSISGFCLARLWITWLTAVANYLSRKLSFKAEDEGPGAALGRRRAERERFVSVQRYALPADPVNMVVPPRRIEKSCCATTSAITWAILAPP
jgi:hypothetical protein